ncbi:CGA synthase-related protein [Streptomyces thermoalcalitolerans]|uniref:CGA synthase-related protein n=1 Tax=Streptomyces thermoalcalitolerans TaxID=65605 RepID=A0ABN1NFA9_9ACTN
MAVLNPLRVLLVDDPGRLDALTARRRVAVHLTEADVAYRPHPMDPRARPWQGAPPQVALVCDAPKAAEELTAQGVPVVYLHCGHRTGPVPAVAAVVQQIQGPARLPVPTDTTGGPGRCGVLAPARTARARSRAGCLVLVSAADARAEHLAAYTDDVLRPLVTRAAAGPGGCDLVCDTGLPTVRNALPSMSGLRLHVAADVDVDALHARAETCHASPTWSAVALARARKAPLELLPPLGPAQRDLAERLQAPPDTGAAARITGDITDDDLRGAQRIARKLRQLAMVPPSM